MKSIKEKGGITLVALAVTIVVILILAGVTIESVFSENGIINKAKEAANAMNNAVANDQKELDSLLNELNSVMDGWEEGGTEGNETTNTEPTPPPEPDRPIGELINNGTIKIGDYVAYMPTGAGSYTVNGTYSGTGSNQVINKENLNWRVLDKTEDGKIRLISASATTAQVTLKGANGYNNAVYLLDELCNTLYKGTNATAKSLKIEDIQNKMNLSVWNYNNYSGYGITYNLSNKQYPLIFAQEMGQIVNGRTGSLGLSEQTSVLTGTANTLTARQTFWSSAAVSWTVNNYIKSIYYNLFQQTGDYLYWLSSRDIYANNIYVSYAVRSGGDSIIHHTVMCNSSGSAEADTYHVRPVVSLESNIEINRSVVGKDGTSPEKAWVIKGELKK